ncbi:hypothetical protein BOTBODRAFT_36301 [Botryobasidium botryosum FD-172 SS1]|uniref:Uncharacterized protein n=1 Tax=Botryobasidium botryosum (strain FD-172 SS1) TaxID=930990 RepID=A0A067MFR4_BOTB1|nr:hypothetical protein BOTBODRAFT_36301 [Botryobasidium botryosum FD-172 SS1]
MRRIAETTSLDWVGSVYDVMAISSYALNVTDERIRWLPSFQRVILFPLKRNSAVLIGLGYGWSGESMCTRLTFLDDSNPSIRIGSLEITCRWARRYYG